MKTGVPGRDYTYTNQLKLHKSPETTKKFVRASVSIQIYTLGRLRGMQLLICAIWESVKCFHIEQLSCPLIKAIHLYHTQCTLPTKLGFGWRLHGHESGFHTLRRPGALQASLCPPIW
jgi:hypothetical protein